jgi:hypothetical protein
MGGMRLAEEFRQWALDPKRTTDELCATELLLEWGESFWRAQNKQHGADHEAQAFKRKERAGNPAYRPKLSKTLIEHTIEMEPWLKSFHHIWHDDRPLRSVAPFQFFHRIEDLNLTLAEVTDLSPLRLLPALKKFTISEPGNGGGFVVKDLKALAGLELTALGINLRAPWPDLRAVADLPKLEILGVRANLLALREIPALLAVTKVTLDADFHYRTPLRNFHDLPAMPKVQSLRIDGIAGLEGVEKLAAARSLDLVGPYEDLTPLAELPGLTYLRLEGERFMDLTPLTKLPHLREILMVREHPLDLGPLADAPALREVFVERCAILRMELSALNAALPPWGLDFLAPEPRPLAPLQFFHYRPQDAEVKEACAALPEINPRDAIYEGDTHYSMAESRWFGRELQQRLDTLLGKGWGDADSFPNFHPGHRHLMIERFKDIVRFDEILQTVRELIAASRYPWSILVSAEPHGDLSKDIEEIRAQRQEQERDWLDQEYDEEQEREDYEEFRKSRRELYERLEREHRLRLLQQQGEEINPADFSPAAQKPKLTPVKIEADEDGFEEDNEGDLPDFGDEPSEFEEEMSFVFVLTENHVWVVEQVRETFESTLGVRTEDWHALAEPPTKRPRPQL